MAGEHSGLAGAGPGAAHARQAGAHPRDGTRRGGSTWRGRETRDAIAGRRGEATAFLRDEDASQLAVVEIEPKKKLTRN